MKPCRKVKHKTRSAAIAALKRINNVGLYPYLCPSCKVWHLAHSRHAWRRAARIGQLLDKAGYSRVKPTNANKLD